MWQPFGSTWGAPFPPTETCELVHPVPGAVARVRPAGPVRPVQPMPEPGPLGFVPAAGVARSLNEPPGPEADSRRRERCPRPLEGDDGRAVAALAALAGARGLDQRV